MAQRNDILAGLLDELGWTSATFAQHINATFGPDTISLTAPYHWREKGSVPRPPLPTFAVCVLLQALGRPVTVGQVWSGRAVDTPDALPRDTAVSWTREATRGLLDAWITGGVLDPRHVHALSSQALTILTDGYLAAEHDRLAAALTGGRTDGVRGGAGNTLLEHIEQSIPMLQRLDDAQGGAAHLDYVGAQVRAVVALLRRGEHTRRAERRLFTALAELAQLAGWMALDASRHGVAHAYYTTALRAAHEAGYRSMGAHVLADLAFQAATRGHAHDAIRLGEAAAAITTVPATVRASVRTRLGYGYALAGRFADHDREHRTALDILAARRPDEPEWMYFLRPSHLDTQTGYALVHAATLHTDGTVDPDAARRLDRGYNLLLTGTHDTPLTNDVSQRRALHEGAWAAVAATLRGDPENAYHHGTTALARLGSVRSPRSVTVLHTLRTTLARRHRNEHANTLLHDLDTQLPRHGRGGQA